MENVLTQSKEILEYEGILSKEFFESYINNWATEEVLLLARHFHKLNDTKTQFERVDRFTAGPSGVDILNAVKPYGIEIFRIYMSLDGESKDDFTFIPIIYLLLKDGLEIAFPLIPKGRDKLNPGVIEETVNSGGQIVPGIFKQMITQNWDVFDVNLIDDLFVAVDSDTRGRLRVDFYEINGDLLTFINDSILGNIEDFTLYPGVDMNKFQNRNLISFTPTIGIVPKETVITDIISRHSIIEIPKGEGGEIFMEYLRPCPPTCPK
ncbi:hypothetical protein [uncultured Aquimarina sp.]|uniref:hypothetical protein n=1 Tax=uncultured Aquimarina sp. TaxID=575652 RepID=UPI0026368798|nr:hypothetical protein [uncultured Aquimarina sp.]